MNKEENNALLILDEKNDVPTFNYIVKQSGDGLDPSALSQYIKITL
ncbi:hypothetical protein [Clostridium estertheticum]|nr:hypothetical protein [Clostridium estertheticum]MCB2358348.1 hypothetical protein [Clostridium estertheticum]